MYIPAGHVEHHLDQVLADIMDVTLDTADDDLGIDFAFLIGNMRPQDIQTQIEGIGAHQHFGHKIFVLFVEVAHDLHAGRQTVHDSLNGHMTIIQPLLRGFLDRILLILDDTVFQLFYQFFFCRHCTSPL